MEKVIYHKDYEDNPDDYIFVDLKNIRSILKERIIGITIRDEDIIRYNGLMIVNNVTDKENPVILKKDIFEDGYYLNINSKWYLENRNLVEDIIKVIILESREKQFSIDDSVLITNDVISSLCNNKNIEMVSLCEYNKKDPYILDKETYLKFKNSNIKKVNTYGVSDEIKDNYDDLIGYNADKRLIGYYKYRDLLTKTIFYFDELSIDELENLKYINSNAKINVKDSNNYLDVINYLEKYGKNNRVIVDVKDKNKFNDFIFNNDINYDNLYVNPDYSAVPLDLYIRSEKILVEMIKPALSLSKFEQYIYAYNIVKQFKKYKEVDNGMDKSDSRNIYKILFNDYMVCVGYAKMFGDLLDKLGIDNKDVGLSVDISYDQIKDNQSDIDVSSKEVSFAGHARRYVHIVDDKYDIDGYYFSDPTWDNDRNQDLYNHMVMTNREINDCKRYVALQFIDEIFCVNNIDEYYEKLNFALERSDKSKKRILEDIIEYIKKLDKSYFSLLIKKYPFLNEIFSNDDENELHNVFYELGEYIVNHVNKEISGDVIMKAVSNVYKDGYGFEDEEIMNIIPKVIDDNVKKQALVFPKRYKIDEYGNKEVIMNEKNKFDIEYKGRSR